MIESILETTPLDFGSPTGTITVAGASASATGSGFSSLTADDLIEVTNDAGEVQHFQVLSIADDANMTLSTTARSVITAKAFRSTTPECDYFMVDNSLLKMPVVQGQTLGGAFNILYASGTLDEMSYHEGFLIKTVYARLPYQMTFADTDYSVGFATTETGSGIEEPTPVGEPGVGEVFLPIENSEVPVNIYTPPNSDSVANEVDYQILAKSSFALSPPIVNPPATIPVRTTPAVSMVNVPNILNGTIQPVIIGMRILHADTAMT